MACAPCLVRPVDRAMGVRCKRRETRGDETDMSERNDWQGEGWYTIGHSDVGHSDGGAIWIDDEVAFREEMGAASQYDTDTHLAYAAYHGDKTLPDECLSTDPRQWCDVNRCFLDDRTWAVAKRIADAKASGDESDVREALYEAATL